jgi:hypothetical protein
MRASPSSDKTPLIFFELGTSESYSLHFHTHTSVFSHFFPVAMAQDNGPAATPAAPQEMAPQQPQEPVSRQPRTHTSPTINQKIEAENEARSLKTLDHTDDPVADAEEKSKRKTPPDDKMTPEESRVTKRRCMDGSLQVEHRSQNLAFNAADHNAAFSRVKLEYKLCSYSEFQNSFASSLGSKLPQAANRGDVKYTKFKPPSSRFHSTSQPFSSGSGRSSSFSSNCLICAEKGHTVFFHLDSPTPIKFLDGKST